jgi:hypothetical protein
MPADANAVFSEVHAMRSFSLVVASSMLLGAGLAEGGPASGTFKAQKEGTISPTQAVAYVVRDSHNARTLRVELMLTDVPLDVTGVQASLDPHMAAINLDEIKDRNYILLWVAPDGAVTMNATFSATMTQFLNDTTGGLKAEFTSHTPSRIEGRVFSSSPLKTMDGSTYTVDLKFAADVPQVTAGSPLPAGGGDAGKALAALLLAASHQDWTAIHAASSPAALKMFDNSYDTPADKAKSTNDLLNAWIPRTKMKIAGGQLRGDTAILEVEGEIFPGQSGLSLVKMVKSGAVWQFEQATRVGMLP